MMRCPTGAYSHGTTLWEQPSMTTCCLFLQLRHNVSTYHAFCPSLLQKCLPTSFLAEKPDTKPVLVCQSTPLTMNVWVWPSPGRQVTSALKLAQKLTAFRPPTVPWKVDTWIVGADTCLILLQNFPAACCYVNALQHEVLDITGECPTPDGVEDKTFWQLALQFLCGFFVVYACFPAAIMQNYCLPDQ